MKILFTGASSFTGYWFASELSNAGHDVTATFRSEGADSYGGIRAIRVKRLYPLVDAVWDVEFGSEKFLELAANQWDLFCHHAADMNDYRSPDFDVLAATSNNARNVRSVLKALAGNGCGRIILTGTVFEPYEGCGDSDQRAFSPYGLSKHFTFELFRLEAYPLSIATDKFVIPNPFGPLEEMRFTSYLIKEWDAGRVPSVRTPDYVRDNIHVSLLAKIYRRFCERRPGDAAVERCSPSGYAESQGAFTQRFAAEIGRRLGRNLHVELAKQVDFSEPMVRTNSQPAESLVADWSERAAWDELFDYYQTMNWERVRR